VAVQYVAMGQSPTLPRPPASTYSFGPEYIVSRQGDEFP
jgi:hypothetical protein